MYINRYILIYINQNRMQEKQQTPSKQQRSHESYKQKYVEKQFIGRGNYGKVYLVLQKKTLEVLVAKKISLEGLKYQQIDRAMREIEIHQHLKHQNIINFRQYFFQDQDILIIIMEYCQFGDLSKYLKNRKEKNELLPEKLIMNLFLQMVYGLQYLHENKIIHRDIKPQNLFINEDGVLKIADFGISKAMETTQEVALTLVGTPYYLSPQACKNQGYTTKSDIWSMGCVLYELTTLSHAFQGTNVLSLANKITNDSVQKIPNMYSCELFHLILSLLKKKPQERPSVKEIIQKNLFVRKYIQLFQKESHQQEKIKKESHQREKITTSNQGNQTKSTNFEAEYYNQFLEDEESKILEQKLNETNISIKSPIKNQQVSPSKNQPTLQTTPSKLKQANYQIDEIISPSKTSLKLKERCLKKLGERLFKEMYDLMRKLKSEGYDEIQIELKIKQKYDKNEFDLAMDVAQLIYVEDNHS